MMDFWDRAWLIKSTVIHDYYEQKRKDNERWEDYCSKTVQEIMDDCVTLTNELDKRLKPQSGIHLHPDLKTGIICLPLYGFLLVRDDGKKLTNNQNYIIQSICSSFRRDIPFSYADYMDATNANSSARSALMDLVGVTEEKAGKFWVQLFKLLYRTNAEDEALFEFLKPFDDLVLKFSALSGPPEATLVPILQLFYLRLKIQSEQCRKLPEDKVDFYGDKSLKEHFDEYQKEALDVLNFTMDEDDEDLNPHAFFRHFTVGAIYQIVIRGTQNQNEKVKIFEDTLEKCGITCFYSKAMFDYPNIPEDEISMGELNSHLYSDPRNPLGWEMLLRAASTYSEKKGDKNKVESVSHAAVNFLISVDNYLADTYSMSGYGDIAPTYCSYVLSIVLNEKTSAPLIDEGYKILYTEPELSVAEMKKRNGTIDTTNQSKNTINTDNQSNNLNNSGLNRKRSMYQAHPILFPLCFILFILLLLFLLSAVTTP